MLYNKKIELLMMERKVTMVKLSSIVGMSRHGLKDALLNHTLKVKTLIDIAEHFKVPVTYFFDDQEKYEKPDVDKVMDVLKKIIKERL